MLVDMDDFTLLETSSPKDRHPNYPMPMTSPSKAFILIMGVKGYISSLPKRGPTTSAIFSTPSFERRYRDDV